MYPRFSFSFGRLMAGCSAAFIVVTASPLHATTFYWDANGTTAGFGTSAVGTWGSSAFWNTDSTGAAGGTLTNATIASGDDINFGTATAGFTTNTTNATTITVSGTKNLRNITYGAGNGSTERFTIAGGTLNLDATSTITSNNGSSGFFSIGNQTTSTATALTGAATQLTVQSTTGATIRFFTTSTGRTTGNTKIDMGGDGVTSSGAIQYFSANPFGTSATTLQLNSGRMNISNGGATITPGYNTTVTGSSALYLDTAAAPVTSATFGTLSIGTQTLTTGVYNGSAAGGITFGVTTLTGNATFNVNDVDTGTGVMTTTLGAVGETGGARSLTKTGSGILKLNAAGTYSGDTVISGGKIALGNNLALQNSAYDTTGSTGAIGLNVTGFTTPTLGGLKGGVNLATAITGYSAVTSLTLNPQTGTSSYSGVIADGASGMTLTKSGSGTQVLTNTNTYTGATTISGGTLQVDGSLASGSTVGVGTAGELSGSGTINGNATLTGSGIISSSGTIAGTLGVTGGNWNGTGSVTGVVNSSSGTFTIGSSANLHADGGLNVTGGTLAGTGTITGHVNYTSSASSSYSGIIAGSGKTLTMNNSSATLTLTGVNTYTGATTVSAGKLVVNGSIASSAVTVNSGGTLGGSGTVGALTVTSGGTVGPGNSPGILSSGNFNLQTAGTLAMEVNGGTVGTQFDQLNVTGTVVLNGTLSLTSTGYTPVNGTLLFILANDGTDAITGNFDTLAEGSFLSVGSQAYEITYLADYAGSSFTGGNDVALMAVPEPGPALLGGLGMLLLLRRRR